ncbi:MAG: hypothetical protein FJ161_01420 [Gammaproteobacteria bacterium]|nr:hypothetical protein [Gammaproteobacteria bacterium]
MSFMKGVKAFVTVPLYREFWLFGVGFLIIAEVLAWLLSSSQFAFEMNDLRCMFILGSAYVTRFKDTCDTLD